MAALKCATCGGPAFIMGRTTVFMHTGNAPRTVYYPEHDGYPGPADGHKATLADADVRAWAAESQARELAELKRVRAPRKKEMHAEGAASYADVAANGTASRAWVVG